MRTILLSAAVTPAALVIACGGGDDASEDERVLQVSGVAELATHAYAAAGPIGLYDYLADDVLQRCSLAGLQEALAGQPQPAGFVRTEHVDFEQDRARAEVVQLVEPTPGETEEHTVEWAFVSPEEGTWRLIEVPGLESCQS